MQRRTFLQGLAAAGALSGLPLGFANAMTQTGSVSVESLPKLEGDLAFTWGAVKAACTRMFLKPLKSATRS